MKGTLAQLRAAYPGVFIEASPVGTANSLIAVEGGFVAGGPREPSGCPTEAAGRRKGKPLVEASVTVEFNAYDIVKFVAFLPVETVSEINKRDWRARSRRSGKAWNATGKLLGRHLRLLVPFAEALHAGKALRVRFTRLGGRKIDRSNLPTACKACEDALAYVMGADDGSLKWHAEWDQEPEYAGVGVKIELEIA